MDGVDSLLGDASRKYSHDFYCFFEIRCELSVVFVYDLQERCFSWTNTIDGQAVRLKSHHHSDVTSRIGTSLGDAPQVAPHVDNVLDFYALSLYCTSSHSYLLCIFLYQHAASPAPKMPTLELDVLKPIDPSIEHSDDYPEFALGNVQVFYASNGKPTSLLSAYADTPLRVQGRLEAPRGGDTKYRMPPQYNPVLTWRNAD